MEFSSLWMRLGDVAVWDLRGGSVAVLRAFRGNKRKRRRKRRMVSCDAGHDA